MAAVLDAVCAVDAPFMIDLETADDVCAREALLDRAMGKQRHRKSSEKIRRGRMPSHGLAFVARDEAGQVIGTVRLWDVTAGIDGQKQPVVALLLGPLAVHPAHEGKGIGSALMRAALMEAAQQGHGAVLLVGDAPYYRRFGFSPETAQHLVMPGPFERARFLGLELKTDWLKGAAGMLVPSGRLVAHTPFKKAA